MKTTLVAVSGMSPAIITETLWALSEESPPLVPDDVVVITTSKGESDIGKMLLSKSPAWGERTVWDCLREDIFAQTGQGKDSNKLQLSVRVIDLPDAKSGIRKKADDLRTRKQNDGAADFIIQTLAQFTTPEDNFVIASIAGGRKTMGALLYAAMSLVGKETDRVTHVLVSEPFDTCREFFYPAQPDQKLEAKPFGQKIIPAKAKDARVEMADIPFVPLRNRFIELKEPHLTFAGLVERYSLEAHSGLSRPPRVSIEIDKGIMNVEGRPIKLSGRVLIVASFLLDRARLGEEHFKNRQDAELPLQTYFQDFKNDYPFHPSHTRLTGDLSEDDLTKALSKIRECLKDKGLEGAVPFLAPLRGRIGFEIREEEK